MNCATNKKAYPSRLEAELAKAGLHGTNARHRKRKWREEPSRSYRCPGCGSWHLTSQPERQSLTG